jgi:hypothetical protein
MTGSVVTGGDASHVTGSDVSQCPEVCSAHAQRKLRHIRPSGGLLTGVRSPANATLSVPIYYLSNYKYFFT